MFYWFSRLHCATAILPNDPHLLCCRILTHSMLVPKTNLHCTQIAVRGYGDWIQRRKRKVRMVHTVADFECQRWRDICIVSIQCTVFLDKSATAAQVNRITAMAPYCQNNKIKKNHPLGLSSIFVHIKCPSSLTCRAASGNTLTCRPTPAVRSTIASWELARMLVLFKTA